MYDSKEKQRAYAHQHYLDNKELYNSRAKKSNQRRRVRHREKLLAYLLEHSCIDCGESDPVVLQFDHVTGEKLSTVMLLVHKGVAWSRVESEMAKCEVVCANCHFRRTARRNGSWFKDIGNTILYAHLVEWETRWLEGSVFRK